MNPMSIEEASETVPGRDRADTLNYLPMVASGKTYLTKYFLLPFLYAIIVPSIELGFGLYYKNDCPIKESISTYMIVAGSSGLAFAGMLLLLKVTLLCVVSDSEALNLVAACVMCLNIIVTCTFLVFLFVWFILGCVWVFGVIHTVQYDFPKQGNYCHPVLYKGAMASLIITLVCVFLQCCVSCVESCFAKSDE